MWISRKEYDYLKSFEDKYYKEVSAHRDDCGFYSHLCFIKDNDNKKMQIELEKYKKLYLNELQEKRE